MVPPPSLRHRVKYGWWDGERGLGLGGPFLSLTIAYIPNLSILQTGVNIF